MQTPDQRSIDSISETISETISKTIVNTIHETIQEQETVAVSAPSVASASSSVASSSAASSSESSWTFLTNHSHVLFCIAADPELRLRDVADRVGITERAVQRIVADLEEARVLTRIKDGRRNRYELHAELPLRHPIESHRTVNDLLKLLMKN